MPRTHGRAILRARLTIAKRLGAIKSTPARKNNRSHVKSGRGRGVGSGGNRGRAKSSTRPASIASSASSNPEIHISFGGVAYSVNPSVIAAQTEAPRPGIPIRVPVSVPRSEMVSTGTNARVPKSPRHLPVTPESKQDATPRVPVGRPPRTARTRLPTYSDMPGYRMFRDGDTQVLGHREARDDAGITPRALFGGDHPRLGGVTAKRPMPDLEMNVARERNLAFDADHENMMLEYGRAMSATDAALSRAMSSAEHLRGVVSGQIPSIGSGASSEENL